MEVYGVVILNVEDVFYHFFMPTILIGKWGAKGAWCLRFLRQFLRENLWTHLNCFMCTNCYVVRKAFSRTITFCTSFNVFVRSTTLSVYERRRMATFWMLVAPLIFSFWACSSTFFQAYHYIVQKGWGSTWIIAWILHHCENFRDALALLPLAHMTCDLFIFLCHYIHVS